ncbi:MAG: glycerophosphodiester phosphodiesterase [Spirochaetales bacterium]|nr:glycerophosphodiester phosphodiesterase [Spirochaetales bacterium]
MNIYPGEKKPYIFAHRGCSKAAPENTLAAFEEALNQKIPGVELDIHLCNSGELVVTHDDNVKRVTGFDGIVEELSYTELKKLDAGNWKGPQFSGEKLPLLEDVFDLLGSSVYYDIEIKSRKTVSSGLEEKLAALIANRGLEERCIVSSFNPMALKFFKKSAPHIPTAIIYCNDGELPPYLRHGEGKWIASADILKPDYKKINRTSMFFNHTIGRRPILPWTIDDPETAVKLIKLGVEGIISNDPASIIIALGIWAGIKEDR